MHIVFKCTGKLTKVDHMLKYVLINFILKTLHSVFPNHNVIKLEINNKIAKKALQVCLKYIS